MEAEPEERLSSFPERRTGREPDIGLVDDVEGRTARILDAVDRKEQIERALRGGHSGAPGFPKDAADEIARLPRPLDLRGEEPVAMLQCSDAAALHELGDPRG